MPNLTVAPSDNALAQQASVDPEKLTHIVNPPLNRHIRLSYLMSAQKLVDYARKIGIPVVALCGKKWVPNDDPEKYEVDRKSVV